MFRYLAITINVTFLTAFAFSGEATADPGRCAGSKLKAASSYSRCILKVQARAATRAQEPDADKLAGCASKLDSAWRKAESRYAGDCPTIGDEADVRALFDCTRLNLDATLAGTHALPPCIPSTPPTTVTTTTTLPECMNTGDIHPTTTTTVTVPQRCMNSVLDGPETEVDCGGDCFGCDSGQLCSVGTDCASRICTDGACASPTCDDGVRNGGEHRIDCGGGGCPGCPAGTFCVSCFYCLSRHCDSNYCQ